VDSAKTGTRIETAFPALPEPDEVVAAQPAAAPAAENCLDSCPVDRSVLQALARL
jgi:hypothetical protein